MTENEYVNRRKYPRATYPCLVVVRNEQGEKTDSVLCHTENIGAGGLSLTIKEKLPLDTLVDIELDLLDCGENVKCRGKIVWTIKRQKDSETKPLYYDMGIEFEDINAQEQERINVMVKKIVKKEDKE